MRKLTVFNQVSLDGYFVDAAGDMSWAKKSDPEWNAFVADNASNAGSLPQCASRCERPRTIRIGGFDSSPIDSQ